MKIYDESFTVDGEECKGMSCMGMSIIDYINYKTSQSINKTNNIHPTKQTVQTESGDEPLVCENELSGSQQGVKTGDSYFVQETDDEKCERIAKEIDPKGTFLDECQEVVEKRFGAENVQEPSP